MSDLSGPPLPTAHLSHKQKTILAIPGQQFCFKLNLYLRCTHLFLRLSVQFCLVWFGLAWLGLAWLGLVGLSLVLVRFALAWFGWFGLAGSSQTS